MSKRGSRSQKPHGILLSKKGLRKHQYAELLTEAGMSSGALRHYFSTQDEMLLFIMNYYLEEGKKRSQSKNWSENPLQAVEEVLLELVPIDEKRKLKRVFGGSLHFAHLQVIH